MQRNLLVKIEYTNCEKVATKQYVSFHSVPRVILTLNISTIGESLIFRSGRVLGIMPYVHFFPLLSLLSNNFFKNWKYQGKKREIWKFPVQSIMVTEE